MTTTRRMRMGSLCTLALLGIGGRYSSFSLSFFLEVYRSWAWLTMREDRAAIPTHR